MSGGLAASPSRWRLLGALALLPPLDALIVFVAFPLLGWIGEPGGARVVDPARVAGSFAMLAGAVSLVVSVCAIPLVFWMFDSGLTGVRHFVLAGLALGNAPPAVYAVTMGLFAIAHTINGTMGQHLLPLWALVAGALRLLALGSVLGLASALAFRALAVGRG